MKFSKSLRANIDKVLWRINVKCYMLADELFTSVVQLSPSPSHPGPYAYGWLANQWYPDTNGFSEELDSRQSDTGADSLSRIHEMFARTRGSIFDKRDGNITLTNNLSYAYRAEALGWPESEGWSGQIGPYRMVALSIQQIATKYK